MRCQLHLQVANHSKSVVASVKYAASLFYHYLCPAACNNACVCLCLYVCVRVFVCLCVCMCVLCICVCVYYLHSCFGSICGKPPFYLDLCVVSAFAWQQLQTCISTLTRRLLPAAQHHWPLQWPVSCPEEGLQWHR